MGIVGFALLTATIRSQTAIRRGIKGTWTMSYLKTEALQKSFGGNHAVASVSIDIEEGELVGLIGPNGSGKTTLLNILSGHLMPDSGRLTLEGRDVTGKPPHWIAQGRVPADVPAHPGLQLHHQFFLSTESPACSQASCGGMPADSLVSCQLHPFKLSPSRGQFALPKNPQTQDTRK